MRLERILFIRTDRLGDLLMNVPALRRLRVNFPKSRISVLCGEASAPALKYVPDIDEVVVWKAGDLVLRRAGQFRSAKFDAVVVSNPSKAMHFLAFATGAGIRAGYARKWGFLLNHAIPDRKDGAQKHEIEHQLQMLDAFCPKPWDGRIELGFRSAPSESLILSKFGLDPEAGFIVFHPATSDAKKMWPAERFSAVIEKIVLETGLRAVVVGAGARPAGLALPERTLDLFGKTSVVELATIVGRARCLVSLDSGPYHLAWMQKTPVVGLFLKEAAASNPKRWGVYPNFSPCREICKYSDEISVEEVVAAAGSLVKARVL